MLNVSYRGVLRTLSHIVFPDSPPPREKEDCRTACCRAHLWEVNLSKSCNVCSSRVLGVRYLLQLFSRWEKCGDFSTKVFQHLETSGDKCTGFRQPKTCADYFMNSSLQARLHSICTLQFGIWLINLQNLIFSENERKRFFVQLHVRSQVHISDLRSGWRTIFRSVYLALFGDSRSAMVLEIPSARFT